MFEQANYGPGLTHRKETIFDELVKLDSSIYIFFVYEMLLHFHLTTIRYFASTGIGSCESVTSFCGSCIIKQKYLTGKKVIGKWTFCVLRMRCTIKRRYICPPITITWSKARDSNSVPSNNQLFYMNTNVPVWLYTLAVSEWILFQSSFPLTIPIFFVRSVYYCSRARFTTKRSLFYSHSTFHLNAERTRNTTNERQREQKLVISSRNALKLFNRC